MAARWAAGGSAALGLGSGAIGPRFFSGVEVADLVVDTPPGAVTETEFVFGVGKGGETCWTALPEVGADNRFVGRSQPPKS